MGGGETDRRAAIGLLTCVLLCTAAAAATLTPSDTQPVRSLLEGLPRLALYAVAAVLLARTGSSWNGWRETSTSATRDGRWLTGWLAAAGVIALVNARRLDHDIADRACPTLWLVSMALVVVAVLPSALDAWRSRRRRRLDRTALALSGLLLLAGAVRFAALATVPANVQADEGDRAASAIDVIDGTAPHSWFDSGWFYVNMVYFRVLAVPFRLFGVGIVQGRAVNAVAGLVVVAAVAWIGFGHFGRRVGLVATAIAAVSPLALQFSRTIAESGVAAALFAVSLAAFLEGGRTGRAWAYALAGAAGGLSLYTYASARSWPLVAGATIVVLVALSPGRRTLVVRGAAVAAVAALVAVLPYAVHLHAHSDEATLRFRQTSVLAAENRLRLPYLRSDMPVAEVIAIQVERSLGLMDRYPDRSDFLPTGRPVFPRLLAALTLLGVFFATWQGLRDPRLAVVALWFWIGLLGIVLTVETPAAQRAATFIVTLPLLAAVALCELAALLPAAARALRSRFGGAPSGLVTTIDRASAPTVATIVGLLMVVQLWSYFGDYRRMTAPWISPTLEGREIAALGTAGPVYALDVFQHRVRAGWVRFLARNARAGSLPDPGAELPIMPAEIAPGEDPRLAPPIPAPSQSMTFVLYGPEQLPYAGLLRAIYPGATTRPGLDGRTTVEIPPWGVRRARGVTVTGVGVSPRVVPSFGDVPSSLQRPTELEWRAGVRIADGGPHDLVVAGPRGTTVTVDGVKVAALERAADATAVRMQLIRGLHLLSVRAPAGRDERRVRVRWRIQGAGGDQALVDLSSTRTYALMRTPWGLIRTVTPASPDANSPTPTTSLDTTLAVAFTDVNQLPVPSRITWRGALLVPRTGVYRLAFLSDLDPSVSLDGDRLAPAALAQAADRGILLRRGAHPVTVRVGTGRVNPAYVRWEWIPPLPEGRANDQDEWTIVPPQVLRPVEPVRRVGGTA